MFVVKAYLPVNESFGKLKTSILRNHMCFMMKTFQNIRGFHRRISMTAVFCLIIIIQRVPFESK